MTESNYSSPMHEAKPLSAAQAERCSCAVDQGGSRSTHKPMSSFGSRLHRPSWAIWRRSGTAAHWPAHLATVHCTSGRKGQPYAGRLLGMRPL